MKFQIFIYCMLILVLVNVIHCKQKKPKVNNGTRQYLRLKNPNFVVDRAKKAIVKPEMPESWNNRTRLPFHPAWMDYCDPYHCNDYHKTACGLNRKNMKFKWFQSVCHVILNNMCSAYRGVLSFDIVDTKFCARHVMFLRAGCRPCQDQAHTPVCGMSSIDLHVVLFRNRCAMDTANCDPETLDEYHEVDMSVCALMQIYEISPDRNYGEVHPSQNLIF